MSQVDRKVGCWFVDVNVSVVQSIPPLGQALDELRYVRYGTASGGMVLVWC